MNINFCLLVLERRFSRNCSKIWYSFFCIEVLMRRNNFLVADHCDYNHDKSNQRQAPRIPHSTGQNLGISSKIILLLFIY